VNGFGPPAAATLPVVAMTVLEAVVAGGKEPVVCVAELRVEWTVATAVVATTPPGLGLNEVVAKVFANVIAMSMTAG